MDLGTYLGLHGQEMEPHTRAYVVGLASAGQHGRHLRGGVLLFTAETADRWAGPFEGGYAAFRLTDHRETRHYLDRRPKARKRTGRELPPRLLVTVGDALHARHPGEHQEMVTTAKPFELRVYGNDDTSYTKFYATEEEALAELALFEGSGPLDFHEFVGFGFTFTN